MDRRHATQSEFNVNACCDNNVGSFCWPRFPYEDRVFVRPMGSSCRHLTKYRGDHLGREVCQLLIDLAFDQLNVPSVVAIVHRSNERSLKLCASLGFNREGVRDNDHDVFVFSREMPRYWTSEILKCD